MQVTRGIRTAAAVGALMTATSVAGVGLAGSASAAPLASAKGTYTVSYNFDGYGGGTASPTLAKHGKFTAGDGDFGTYTYKKKKLTFVFTSNDCGTTYTGTGTPKAGFSGTILVKNSEGDCLPQGTTGEWSTGAKGQTAQAKPGHVSASGLR